MSNSVRHTKNLPARVGGVKLRKTTLTAAAAISLLVGLFLAVPASAHHKPDHVNGGAAAASDKDGDADSNPGTAFTEDNDSDGVANNISDSGDNAHPSGKDRSVEHGNSGNQGKSESTPDQNGKGPERDNGGTDKPNGPGGADIFDQDGNNGCGNDDDFDDDNEGKCGGNKADKPSQDDDDEGNNDDDDDEGNNNDDDDEGNNNDDDDDSPPVTSGTPTGSSSVLPAVLAPSVPAAPGAPSGSVEDDVLGVVITRGAAEASVEAEAVSAELAFTGGNFSSLVTLALMFLVGGAALVFTGRRMQGVREI
jgi:hypothetical protein